jgi:hypothetical protein
MFGLGFSYNHNEYYSAYDVTACNNHLLTLSPFFDVLLQKANRSISFCIDFRKKEAS